MKCFKFILLTWLLSSQAVLSQEITEFYNGARSMAMGGAQLAVVNDETALVVNPAALGKLRNNFITLFDPEIGMNGEAASLLMSDPEALWDLEKVDAHMRDKPGKFYHHHAQLFPSLVFPNVGIGVLGNYKINYMLSEDQSQLYINYRNDFSFVTGFNLRFFYGMLKVGANLRVVQREEVNEVFTTIPSYVHSKYIADAGTGIASDVSAIVTLPWAWLPTVTAVYRDIGQTSYDSLDGYFYKTPNIPDSTPSQLDVAVGLFPIVGRGKRLSMTYELRDVLSESFSDNMTDYSHMGLEYNHKDTYFLRAGMNQSYWTAGFEYATELTQWQLATYGEKISIFNQEIEDRRYMFKFSFRF